MRTFVFGLSILMFAFLHAAQAQLKPKDADKVIQLVGDKKLAEFINTHAKRIYVSRKKLKRLDLSGKKLVNLPAGIGSLVDLEELNLRGNLLRKLPASMGDLKNLRQLTLSNNKLTQLPRAIGNLQSLETLDLSLNSLIRLPNEIGNLKQLTELTLIGGELKSLPKGIVGLESLETLSLSGNHISAIPEGLSGLQRLEVLDLSDNNLSSLAESIGSLQNLKKLVLSKNHISSLPHSIGRLENLKRLVLSRNKLTNLPEEVGNLISLENLQLENNQLVQLPKTIGQMQSLKIVYLENNKLTTIPVSIGELINLKILHLNDNPLKTLPTSFADLEKLNNVGFDNAKSFKENGTYDKRAGESVKELLDRNFKFEWRDPVAVAEPPLVSIVAPVENVPTPSLSSPIQEPTLKQSLPNLESKLADFYVKTQKAIYAGEERIVVEFGGLTGNSQDWISVVPKGTPDGTYQEFQWFYTDGQKRGLHTIDVLPVGEYEVRLYFDSGYDVQARFGFGVEKGQDLIPNAEGQAGFYVKTKKTIYAVGEAIVIEYGGLPGNDQDWVSVVVKGTPEDSYQDHWFYTEGKKDGNYKVEGLPAGDYEVRVYFDGGYDVQTRFSFQIEK
ncbi:MAG: hypothetical protein HOE48_11700 [Candidatus Latescibacteria bacterium]|jgi:Leucine-rich repeat (LRR) protein|nr:hypothetical protein [Candidatus Latescibacterota bacterium]MBT4138574.1 hypothetical protein [Candidatus Latescibacterota bacterium]MBT5830233.1 hypothetical protein [Candidatus Latescibacterota bacterium]